MARAKHGDRELWLLFATVFATVVGCFGQQTAGNFVVYQGRVAVAAGDTVGQFVPTVSDCVALSLVAPLSNGVSFNDGVKQCKVLPATNNEIVLQLQSGVGWTTYVKDISNELRVVFKVSGSIASVADAAQVNTSGIYLGTVNSSYLTTSFSTAMSESCGCMYRNEFIDNWTTSAASQIIVTLFSGNKVVATYAYTGIGQNNTSWFSQNNLVSTQPYDLQQLRFTSFARYSIAGPRPVRGFAITTNNTGCDDDKFYLVVTNEVDLCPYVVAPFPNIIYSATRGIEKAMSTGIAKADYMVVSAKFTSRVVFV